MSLSRRRFTQEFKLSAVVSFEVACVHFLMGSSCHEMASCCCRQRIIPASKVAICDRTSMGSVSFLGG